MTGMPLTIGMYLNINDECVGRITEETADQIYIESDCFTGWAKKSEIRAAIRQSARSEQSPRKRPQSHAFAS